MNKDQLKGKMSKIRNLIIQNRITQALDELLAYVQEIDDRYLRDFIIQTYAAHNNFHRENLLNLDEDKTQKSKVISAILGFINEIEDFTNETKKAEPYNEQELNSTNTQQKILLEGIKRFGVINITSGLQSTIFEPSECMQTVNKKIYFMGIFGSKWVKSSQFSKFIVKTEALHGEAKFLLLNPLSQAYKNLYSLRDGSINTEPLDQFYLYTQKYDCLKVKLYDTLPSFRMVFIDDTTLALSNYKHEKKEYFESKFGWENPHIVISSNGEWSLFKSFEDIFHMIWNRSITLEEYKSASENNPSTSIIK